jgi:hypothetical protein
MPLRMIVASGIYTEWQLPISGVHPIMMEKLFLAGELQCTFLLRLSES